MRFFVTSLILSLSSVAAVAAPKNAEVALSGNVSQNKVKGEAGTSFGAHVRGDYLFLIDRFAVGPTVGFSRFVSKDREFASNQWDVSLGAKGKFYLADVQKDQWVPYAGLALTGTKGKSKFGGGSEADSTTTEVTPSLGMLMFLSDNVALNVDLAYETTFYEDKVKDVDDKDTSRHMGADLNIGLSVFL